MPEPLIALQFNSPIFMKNALTSAQDFSPILPVSLNFHRVTARTSIASPAKKPVKGYKANTDVLALHTQKALESKRSYFCKKA